MRSLRPWMAAACLLAWASVPMPAGTGSLVLVAGAFGPDQALCPHEVHTDRIAHTIPPVPPKLDVVFAFDLTGSMTGVVQSMQTRAEEIFTETSRRFRDVHFAVATFRDYPFQPYGSPGGRNLQKDWAWRVEQRLTNQRTWVRLALSRMSAGGGGDGPEAYARAVWEAGQWPSSLNWRAGTRRAFIILGDSYPHDDDLNEGIPYPQPLFPGQPFVSGYPPTYLDPGRSGDAGHNDDTSDDIDFQAALEGLRQADVTLLVVHANTYFPVSYWDHWAKMTAPGGVAIPLGDPRNLTDVLMDLLTMSTRRIGRIEVRVEPALYRTWVTSEPSALTDVTVPPEGLEVGFDVHVSPPSGAAPGEHVVNLVLTGDGAEYDRRQVRVTVPDVCLPTPTATVPTATPTVAPTATLTPSVTPTATPVPKPIYLPVADQTACRPRQPRSDVVLVLDASTSMQDPTSAGGQTKIAAAVQAARAFAGWLHMPRDRVALVAFNHRAWTVLALTADPERAAAVIEEPPLSQGTRIDLGLLEAHAVVTEGAGPDREPVVVLLTDGRPNGATPEEVLAAASRLKLTGARLFVIGVGDDVDHGLLRRVAGANDEYRSAAEAEDLEAVYRHIAALIPCR